MILNFENETDINLTFSYEEVCEKVCLAVLDYEEFSKDVLVELTITDNEGIHEINLSQRNIDRPTDVLSFPMIDFSDIESYQDIYDDNECLDPETGLVFLGCIVISVDKIKEQAEEYGHSELREFAFLVCHSMLHLLGYDHMTEDEEKEMFAKQKEVMEIVGISR